MENYIHILVAAVPIVALLLTYGIVCSRRVHTIAKKHGGTLPTKLVRRFAANSKLTPKNLITLTIMREATGLTLSSLCVFLLIRYKAVIRKDLLTWLESK